ncbi:hypothetical protein PUNSTDRAFT_96624 [Punctularia strigosozonata HHB-11173 SS5]|uniref:uncharacterized protein n=1 Tax=Punctularia strigosozonata (strain HHB-11173) TaxID=741275 RepID=UPI0004416981|nr:uncharacterized protein PUNSTDRAFT_96624 [Punctularia strigosozonata HHB-11173 SS5]EIN14633.1 hypothetical protein PUNSTDRAFT_96624 [Punctularia strigosozonata HHB-11173 SS5]
MTCDEGRPCQRCIKREIGHLCHDEPRQSSSRSGDKSTPIPSTAATPGTATPTANGNVSRTLSGTTMYSASPMQSAMPSSWMSNVSTQGQSSRNTLPYQPETGEFSVLSNFLETLDERSFFNSVGNPPTVGPPTLVNGASFSSAPLSTSPTASSVIPGPLESSPTQPSPSLTNATTAQTPTSLNTTSDTTVIKVEDDHPHTEATPVEAILPAATKAERFLLTAADQEDGSRDQRLSKVIRSKYEAGLLKPYNYVKGYARLSRWMDRNVSQESKQAILQPLSIVRPKFRAIAQSLTDIDLVFIEEAFERLLLDYDRVFSAMGIPACLWRRTGEIYKGNREFAELVGVDGYMLRDGRLCIYELMAEDSAVNYWEKYGHVAFDSKQKAVLTSCVLRYKPLLAPPSMSTKKLLDADMMPPQEEGLINCCFSFTIRRDTSGIPSMIVGNFIRC